MPGPQERCGAATYAKLSCFSFHPRKIITTGEGGMVMLWDLSDKSREPTVLKGHIAPVRKVAISPDGKLLVSGDARELEI